MGDRRSGCALGVGACSSFGVTLTKRRARVHVSRTVAGPLLAAGGSALHLSPVTEITARLSAALADRYTIERELGAGGMATFYLAEDLKLERTVAVKVLRPDLAAALGPERCLREIEIATRLTHPHMC